MKTPKYLLIAAGSLAIAFAVSPLPGAPTPHPRLPTRSPSSTLPTRRIPGPAQLLAEPTKLFVYTQNGLGTTRTATSGEFPSQLSTDASIGGPFVLRWTREKASNTETKGMLHISDATGATVGQPIVSIPAKSTVVDIPFTFPARAKPGDYTAIVKSGQIDSNPVILKYTGTGSAHTIVVQQGPTPGPTLPPAPSVTDLTSGNGSGSTKIASVNLYGPAVSRIALPKAGEILPPVRPGVKMLPVKTYSVKLPPVGNNAHLVPSRAAITHQPFEMVHSETGQKLDPKTVITLPDSEGRRGMGKKITVGEFFAAMNQTEKSLNKEGYSLRAFPPRTDARTAVSREKISLAQSRNPRSRFHLPVDQSAPLGAYLGIKRVDLPEFPMEWLPAPAPMLYSMNWSPIHFLVKHAGGTKKLVWQVASEPFPDAGTDWKEPPGLIKSGEITDPQFDEYPRFAMKGKHTWQKLDFLPFLGMPDTSKQLYVRFIALDAKGEPVAGPSRVLTFNYGNFSQPVVKIPQMEMLVQKIPQLELPGGDSPFGVFVKSKGLGGFTTIRNIYDGKVTDLSSGGEFVAGVRVYNPAHLLDSSKPVGIEVPIASFRVHLDPIKNKLVFDMQILDESKFADPTAILNPSSLLQMKEADGFPKTQETKLEMNYDQPIVASFEEEIPIYDGITLNLTFSLTAHIGVKGEIHKTPNGLGVEGEAGPYAYASFTVSGSVHPPGLVQPHLDASIELIHDDFKLKVNLQPETMTLAFSGENTISGLKGSAVLAVDVMVPSPKKAIKGFLGVITFQDLTPDMPVSWTQVWHLDLYNQPDYMVSETSALFD